jgi:hypothetical protein
MTDKSDSIAATAHRGKALGPLSSRITIIVSTPAGKATISGQPYFVSGILIMNMIASV